jgi:branched-chain amino acid transport system ATP-binding protein
VLEISGLEINYGAVEAVRGLDLTVGPGETVGLLGPNGAGKTSTLRAATGLVSYRGSVRYEGREISRMGTEAAAKAGLIHVPEGRHVFRTLSVHENLLVGTTARGSRGEGYSIDDVYSLFPLLGQLRDRAGWALSGGEQQMVAIGRALVAAPRMLLLDEPSLGLAPIVVKAVFGALREISKRTPVLLVEQNTVMALRICQRAAVLVGGRIVLQGTAAELSDRTALLDSFLGQERIHEAEAV